MAKSVKVSLGGTDYDIPMMDIDQLERVTDAISAGAKGFAILRIGLEQADPPIPDPNKVRAKADEVRDAVRKILEISGFRSEDPAPGEAAPAAA